MFNRYTARLAAVALLGAISFPSAAQLCSAPTPLVPDGTFSAVPSGGTSPWVLYGRGTTNGLLRYKVDFAALQLGYRQPRVLIEGESNFVPPYVMLSSELTKGTTYYAQCFAGWDSNYNDSFIQYDRLGMTVTQGYASPLAVGVISPPSPGHTFMAITTPYCPGGGCGVFWERAGGLFVADGGEDRVSMALFAGGTAERVTGGMTWGYFAFDNVGVWPVPRLPKSLPTACQNESVQLGDPCTVMPGGTTYSWSSDDDESRIVTTATGPSITVRTTFTATYTLTVHLPNGETYASSVTVNRNPDCISLGKASTPTATSFTPASEVYPIPADGEVHVRVGEATAATVHNAYGFPVQQLKLRAGEERISTRALPNGVYYLRYTENGKPVSKRLVIRH